MTTSTPPQSEARRRDRDAAYYQRNKASIKKKAAAHHLRRKYGITPQQHADLFESQQRQCAICAASDPKSKQGQWHTDHDHRTGAVRGILCLPCNMMLGHAFDNTETLAKAITYLGK